MNFGREISVNSNENKLDVKSELQFGSRKDYADRLGDIPKVLTRVQENMSRAILNAKNRYDLKRRDVRFEPKEIVWCKIFTLSDAANYYTAKLAPKYIKCTVARRIGHNVYELRDFDSGKSVGNYHVKDIKKCY